MTSEARVPTEKAEKYANRLCKHFAYEIQHHPRLSRGGYAEWRAPEGVAEFPEFATCRMTAEPNELVLKIEATDPEKLARMQKIVGAHFEQFAKGDGLRVEWSERSGTSVAAGRRAKVTAGGVVMVALYWLALSPSTAAL